MCYLYRFPHEASPSRSSLMRIARLRYIACHSGHGDMWTVSLNLRSPLGCKGVSGTWIMVGNVSALTPSAAMLLSVTDLIASTSYAPRRVSRFVLYMDTRDRGITHSWSDTHSRKLCTMNSSSTVVAWLQKRGFTAYSTRTAARPALLRCGPYTQLLRYCRLHISHFLRGPHGMAVPRGVGDTEWAISRRAPLLLALKYRNM